MVIKIPISPLSPKVILTLTQVKITTSTIAQYNADSDPTHHVSKFTSYINSMGATDATQCHLFPLIRGDQAYRWFGSLPLTLVDSFHKLAQSFLTHFATLALYKGTK